MSNDIHQTLMNIESELQVIRSELEEETPILDRALSVLFLMLVVMASAYIGSVIGNMDTVITLLETFQE